MPIPLLIALLIAFGMELSGDDVPGPSVSFRLIETLGGILLIAALSFGLGGWVAAQVSHLGYASGRVFRRYLRGSRILTVAGLTIYAWIIYLVGWPRLVLSNWGLQGLVLVDDLAILLPFFAIQLITWSGLYLAERTLHDERAFPRLPTYLALKARQSAGLVLPVVLIFVIRQDLCPRLWPQWHQSPAAEPIELAVLGLLVLAISPLFIRLAWPTRSLPAGPLRNRLERVARRVGFRFNDLLIWDTRHLMVNACVTGVLPYFRYVLLTDDLIDSLSPVEVAAVFGHELGHVAHRHLPFFGFFFLGSLGLLSLVTRVCSLPSAWFEGLPWIPADQISRVGEFAEAALHPRRSRAPFSGWYSAISRADSRGRLTCSRARSSLAASRSVLPISISRRAPTVSSPQILYPPGFARSVSRSSRMRWPKLPARTESTLLHAPGGTAASPIGSSSSGDYRPTPGAKNSFNEAFAPSA